MAYGYGPKPAWTWDLYFAGPFHVFTCLRRPTTPRATTRRPKLSCKVQGCGGSHAATACRGLADSVPSEAGKTARDLSSL